MKGCCVAGKAVLCLSSRSTVFRDTKSKVREAEVRSFKKTVKFEGAWIGLDLRGSYLIHGIGKRVARW